MISFLNREWSVILDWLNCSFNENFLHTFHIIYVYKLVHLTTLRNCKKSCIWHSRVKVKNRNFIYFWLRPNQRRLQSPNGFLIPTVANYVIKTRIIRHALSQPMTIESKSGLTKFLATQIITNLYISEKKLWNFLISQALCNACLTGRNTIKK